MIDVYSVAQSAIQAINENILITYKRSIGSTIGTGLIRTPNFDVVNNISAQLQEASDSELKHVGNVSQDEIYKVIYMMGDLRNIVRVTNRGGDIVVTPDGQSWLVKRVVESWPTWTKAIVCLQLDLPT